MKQIHQSAHEAANDIVTLLRDTQVYDPLRVAVRVQMACDQQRMDSHEKIQGVINLIRSEMTSHTRAQAVLPKIEEVLNQLAATSVENLRVV